MEESWPRRCFFSVFATKITSLTTDRVVARQCLPNVICLVVSVLRSLRLYSSATETESYRGAFARRVQSSVVMTQSFQRFFR